MLRSHFPFHQQPSQSLLQAHTKINFVLSSKNYGWNLNLGFLLLTTHTLSLSSLLCCGSLLLYHSTLKSPTPHTRKNFKYQLHLFQSKTYQTKTILNSNHQLHTQKIAWKELRSIKYKWGLVYFSCYFYVLN